jgi:tRNA uridine 5-carbamoylmethylation protein Kti12
MTIVINLFGSSNSGKSTTAAGLYFQLKKKHTHCEMVREYVKNWAWEGRAPGKWDQPYIASKQMKYESLLYNKVDFIVTDSPFLLSHWYESLYHDTNIVKPLLTEFTKSATNNGIKYLNIWLDVVPHIDVRGRYQSEEEIKSMSEPMKKWAKQICNDCGMDLIELDSLEADERIDQILKMINL